MNKDIYFRFARRYKMTRRQAKEYLFSRIFGLKVTRWHA